MNIIRALYFLRACGGLGIPAWLWLHNILYDKHREAASNSLADHAFKRETWLHQALKKVAWTHQALKREL